MDMTKYVWIGCLIGFLIGTAMKSPKLVLFGLPVLFSAGTMFFPGWATSHPVLSEAIFYGLVAAGFLPWIYAVIEWIADWHVQKKLEQREIEIAIARLKNQQRIAQ